MNTQQKNPETGLEGTNLWLGLILAGTAFAVNGFLGFVIVWRTCYIGHGHLGSLAFSEVRYLLAGITAALFATAVYGGWHSYRNWRTVTNEKEFLHAAAAGTAEYVSMLGVLCSTFLSVGIVWFCVGLIFLPVCQRAH